MDPQPSAPSLSDLEISSKDTGSTKGSIEIERDDFTSTVELTIAAKNLPNMDLTSKSDPFCVCYIRDRMQWVELDQTESIKNDLHPQWDKKISVNYNFEKRQMLMFRIFDKDGTSSSLSSHDFLGEMSCSLGEILSSPHGKLTKKLDVCEAFSGRCNSFLEVVAEEVTACKKFLAFKVTCLFLRKDSRGNKSNCDIKNQCLCISKRLDDGSWVLLTRTSRLQEELALKVSSITSGGNLERSLKFQFYDKPKNSKWKTAKHLGEFETNYLDIIEKYRSINCTFQLSNFRSEKKETSGSVKLSNVITEERKTFIDYLNEGLHLEISLAIDFTASNGCPSRHDSLHRLNNVISPSPYVMAIKIIGEVLEDYSLTKEFATFGFGAKGFPEGNRVSHCFPINFKIQNPYCKGFDGILKAYERVLKKVKFYGPTNFAPTIRNQKNLIDKTVVDANVYHVLVILTDGEVCDLRKTVDEIVAVSCKPLSIIIVGIGDECFDEMDKLDSDGCVLEDSSGKTACRDIVQFVEFKRYIDYKSTLPPTSKAKAEFSRAILAELPHQVCQWKRLFIK